MSEPWGTFCEVFGITSRNRVLEFFLESEDADYSIDDVAEQTCLDELATARTIFILVKEELLVLSRISNHTQLYQLNMDHELVKQLKKEFETLLNELVKGHSIKLSS